MKALLVDDDPSARFLLRATLTREFAWTTLEAPDGLAALKVLETNDVGIVFLDLHMPGLGGIETLRILRDSPRHASLPVIVMTADNHEEIVTEAITLGVGDYLVKPLRAAAITDRVTRALTRMRRAVEPVKHGTVVSLSEPPVDVDQQRAYGRHIISATEQVLGMMISADVEQLKTPPALGCTDGVGVIVNLDAGASPVWRFELAVPMACASKIGAAFGIDPDAVTPEGLTSTVTELSRMISGRFRNVIRQQGPDAQTSTPQPTAIAWPPDPVPHVAPFVFLRAGECFFGVSMTYDAGGGDQRPA